MKRLIIILALTVFTGFLIFGQAEKQEEIDFLLFLPNSGRGFVNEAQASVQLDTVAKFITGRNLNPGQILVYGYTADVNNNIDPVNLSRERALFVINELQKRGVSRSLFSDPIASGSVDLWGGNKNEEDRSPNRRVRIVVDGAIITPDTIKAAEAEIKTPAPLVYTETPAPVNTKAESGSKFPWKILLALLILILLFLLIFLLSRLKRKPAAVQEKPVPVRENKPAPAAAVPAAPVIESKPAPAAAVPVMVSETRETLADLEPEIRFRAYEHYLWRNGQNGDADGDWHLAVAEISAKYQAEGYEVYTDDGYWHWHARKSTVVSVPAREAKPAAN